MNTRIQKKKFKTAFKWIMTYLHSFDGIHPCSADTSNPEVYTLLKQDLKSNNFVVFSSVVSPTEKGFSVENKRYELGSVLENLPTDISIYVYDISNDEVLLLDEWLERQENCSIRPKACEERV